MCNPQWLARFSVLASLCCLALFLVTLIWFHPCEHVGDESIESVEAWWAILGWMRLVLALLALVLASGTLALYLRRALAGTPGWDSSHCFSG